MEPVCAWKSLKMNFRLFVFVFFFDVVWRLTELDVVKLFGRSFASYLWVWAEDILFGESRRTFLKLENSFEAVWRSLRTFGCLCVWLCTTLLRRRVTELSACVVWLKSQLWKKSDAAHGSGAPVILRADAKRGCCDLWKIDTGLLRRFWRDLLRSDLGPSTSPESTVNLENSASAPGGMVSGEGGHLSMGTTPEYNMAGPQLWCWFRPFARIWNGCGPIARTWRPMGNCSMASLCAKHKSCWNARESLQ